ncbi:MAG TPA: DUF2723 domain-containing protein [Gemmatimonadales bacterium]
MSAGAERPPYRAAVAVFVLVLAGYTATLAPSVTFWDAGEFIAAAKILGIPHPPGTPLFVMLAHVWALLVPLGEYAWRTNLMSAAFGAAGAALWFLVAHDALGSATEDLTAPRRRLVRLGAGFGAAMLSAFGFTQWQNAVETEVYAVATFTVATVVWLALRWRAARGTSRASRHLLLAVYLGGLSMGSHLLALLVGPPLVAFLLAELLGRPAPDTLTARREWGEAAVVGGVWALLFGTGLGNMTLIVLGALCWVVAAVYAARRGAGVFAGLALILALVGSTTYLFLYIRAGQNPIINEADPSTWNALLEVIQRKQYGIRTPLDDPTELHGPGNPGRNLTLVALQLINYFQYFDWQWAKAVPGILFDRFPVRTFATIAFTILGLRGAFLHRRSDRAGWWLVSTLFLITGLGLVAYMNFEPGYSVGYDRYPEAEDHEVRERDYFFVASFVVWGVWAGMGLAELARRALERWRLAPPLAASVFLVALAPFLLNFSEASRRHVPGARLAGDFAYDLLNSVPAYGILFTYGDNDTFPLWWAQEVEGIRPDVTVVCLALAETPWYMRQLRDFPIRPFEPSRAPTIWRKTHLPRPEGPLHTMTDADVDAAIPQALPRAIGLRIGPYEVTLPEQMVLTGRDFASIRVIQQNLGRRPISWALTAAGPTYGLDRLLVQQGLVIRILETPPDTTSGRYDTRPAMGAPIDLPITDSLLFGTYRYAGLLETGIEGAESTARSMASTLGVVFTQMAFAAQARGDLAATARYLEPAARLSGNPAIRAALDEALDSVPSNRR